MGWSPEAIRRRLGLDSEGGDGRNKPVLLTGASTDPKTGFIAALSSLSTFDGSGIPGEIAIDYLRHLPRGQGETQRHGLIGISFDPVPGRPGEVEPSKIMIQSFTVFDKSRGDSLKDPLMQKRVNRVFGAVNRVNTMLRNREPVEDVAKILIRECKLTEVTGEALVLRGLSPDGGFAETYLPALFTKAAANDDGPLEFRNVDISGLKTLLGFRVNTLDAGLDHSGDRKVSLTDPDTGVGFIAGVRVKETPRKFEMEIYAEPEDVPEGMEPKPVPNLLKFTFRKKGGGFVLAGAKYMDEPVSPADTRKVLNMIGVAQAANAEFSKRRYPAFIDSAYQFDLSDAIDPLSPPPKEGDMIYFSLHGSGTEKKVENVGDQIGIASLFLRRNVGADGKTEMTGVAIDMPFASGGPDSAHDGAVPDYLPFLKHIKIFAFTHKHFDHMGGFKYYVEKGHMQDKTVAASERDMFFLRKELQGIPRKLWPKMIELDREGAMPVRNDKGDIDFWIQYCPEATDHSALCSPYIVTGCKNDERYYGSALVYGDSRGFKEDKKPFFQLGTRTLPKFAAEQGLTVTLEKVDRDITIVLHDVTAVRDLGPSPDRPEVTQNIAAVMGWYKDKIKVFDPISTNDAEYVIGLDIAALSDPPLNVTAVGANAQAQMSSKNIYGVNPDLDLSKIRLETGASSVPVLPPSVLAAYRNFLEEKDSLHDTLAVQFGNVLEHVEESKPYKNALKRVMKRHLDAFMSGDGAVEGPFRSVGAYMLDRLMKHDAVTFENDVNGYLMWKAIEAGRPRAASYHTRTSDAAKAFRDSPESLMILTTGTQGTVEERFSTLQKFIDSMSLLDADERVRPTGYRIDPKKSAWIIPQSAIVGNENAQRLMVDALVSHRDVDAVVAFRDGFTVHNLRGRREAVIGDLKGRGKNYQAARGDGLEVFAMPIHYNGHGHQPEISETAKTVRAELHAPHHIPDANAIGQFNTLLDRHGIPRVEERPDDFKGWRIDASRKGQDKFKCVAHINPSYIFVDNPAKYGRGAYNRMLGWMRMTVLKREGLHRDDALHVASPSGGVFRQGTASIAWSHVSNPKEWQGGAAYMRRRRKMGPSPADRRPPQAQRSRPMLSAYGGVARRAAPR